MPAYKICLTSAQAFTQYLPPAPENYQRTCHENSEDSLKDVTRYYHLTIFYFFYLFDVLIILFDYLYLFEILLV